MHTTIAKLPVHVVRNLAIPTLASVATCPRSSRALVSRFRKVRFMYVEIHAFRLHAPCRKTVQERLPETRGV